jgi:hypothetical protein
MKKISRLLAQDERRPKPRITLPRLAADDDADVSAAPAMETPEREKIIAAAERRRAMLDERRRAMLDGKKDRARWQPKDTTTSADDNRWFEALTIAEIDRLSTRAWANMAGFWLHLPSAWPSTQKRLLVYMLEEAARRGDPLRPEFVKRLALHLARILAVTEARDSVHDIGALRAAARCRAENPNASWSDLARAAGLKSENARHVVRQWDRFAEFKRWVVEFEKRRGTERPMVPGEEGFEDRGTNAAAWLDPPREGGHNAAYFELAAKDR